MGLEYDVVVRARRMITPEGERAGSLGIVAGRIALVAQEEASLAGRRTVVLADDEVLLPGLVDSHVHVNEPGRTEWEGFASATSAAARGGITTIVDMPLNSLPSTVTVDALEIKKKAADAQCSVDTGFWGGAIPGNTSQLHPLWDAGVFGFKSFLAFSGVEEFPQLDAVQLREAMTEIASFDGLLIVHAEDDDELAAAAECAGPRYLDFLASRPPVAENVAIARVIDTMRQTGARVHILHLSSAEALPLIRAAKAEGLPLTVETCPHYLHFAAEVVPDGATQYKCCPPIREKSNQDALWAALADGVIDLIASDHSPCTADLKRFDTGDFGQAWGGVASVQVGLPVIWSNARERGHDLSDVVRWMAQGPAQLTGLTGTKGALAVGYDADFSIFAPDDEVAISAVDLDHRNAVTPYDGLALTGAVRSTWLRGRQIGESAPFGRFLTRS